MTEQPQPAAHTHDSRPGADRGTPSPAVGNFMRQQGFAEEPPDACDLHFQGLYFQPRIVFLLVVVGTVLQSPVFFLALSAVLWWNALVPKANPFELAYNRFVARPRGTPMLGAAPGPRRFAQGMAAAFLLAAGLCLLQGWSLASGVFQGLLVVAFSALLFGKFCMGAWVFHVLRGEVAFANSTLPWARGLPAGLRPVVGETRWATPQEPSNIRKSSGSRSNR